jgi:hypothetical protein
MYEHLNDGVYKGGLLPTQKGSFLKIRRGRAAGNIYAPVPRRFRAAGRT